MFLLTSTSYTWNVSTYHTSINFWKIQFLASKIDHFGAKSQKLKKFCIFDTTWEHVFNAGKRQLRCFCLLAVLIDEKQTRCLHRRIFWKIYFWGPKSTIFEQNLKIFQKGSSSSVQQDNIFLMLANDSYDVSGFYAYSLMKKKYVVDMNEFFLKNILFRVQNRPFLSEISNISKNSSSSAQHGNFFPMPANDSYDVSACLEYSQMKNKCVVYINEYFEKLTFWVKNQTLLSKISKNSKNSFSSVQHGNFILILTNDVYDVLAYLEYS